MDVEEVERGGENGGDIMVEEEDQLIDDHLEQENSGVYHAHFQLQLQITLSILHTVSTGTISFTAWAQTEAGLEAVRICGHTWHRLQYILVDPFSF